MVIEGAGVIEVNGVRIDVVVGDCVFVEPGERHIVINPNAEPLRCVIATGPAWQPEDSFQMEIP